VRKPQITLGFLWVSIIIKFNDEANMTKVFIHFVPENFEVK
jgi:hypothetical protein